MTKRGTAPGWVPGPRDGPTSPLRLSRPSLWSALRCSVVEFDRDNAWDWAAALTYYAVLSVFPGLLVIVSLVGLARPAEIGPLVDSLGDVAPGPVRSILTDAVRGLQDSPRQAGLFAAIGVVVALWSASGYAAAFIRAANAAYDVPEGRPIWKTLVIRMAVTIVTGVLLVASATIVVVTGNLAAALGRVLGLESSVVNAWNIGKWPLLVLLVCMMCAVLYWASPNAQQGGFRWVSPGCMVAVVLWLAASAGFGLYAVHVPSYDRIYGALAGVVVFLTWLWITNLALLLGLEVDAELERQRAIAAGLPPGAEPYLRLRDDTALAPTGSAGLSHRTQRPDAEPADDPELTEESEPNAGSVSVDDGALVNTDGGKVDLARRRVRGSTALTIGFTLGLAAGVAVATTRHRRRLTAFWTRDR